MSTVIKNGTIVTHDLTYKADVLIDDGKIIEIGKNLSGTDEFDATDCYVMPGGIDPHTHLEMPFMGTYSTDDFESGTRAALAGGTTMVIDFALPSPGQGLHDALKMWDNKSTRANCDYSFHMAVTWWGEQVFDEMESVIKERGINTFKHFLAYKGALMVNDDELFASFNRLSELGGIAMVHAENGDVVAELSAKLLAEGNTGPEAHVTVDQINREVLSFLFKGELPTQDKNQISEARQQKRARLNTSKASVQNTSEQAIQNSRQPSSEPVETIVREQPKIGRNEKVTIKNIMSGEEKEVKFKQAIPLIEKGSWVLIQK